MRCVSFALQNDSWKVGERLGSGASGTVFAVTNPRFSDVVVKAGSEHSIKAKAELLWGLDHPGVPPVHVMLHTDKFLGYDEPMAYMVLQRPGPSLQDEHDSDKR